jgi:3D (Asp-Asp-Asp) domain-containing protein
MGAIRKTIGEIAWDVANLAPAAIFLFVSLVPGEALAYAQQIEMAHRPLVFMKDDDLVKFAIVGQEKWSKGNESLSSTVGRIPTAGYLQVGSRVRVLATAYSSTVDQTDANPFYTASGTHVHPGTLAANFLPFGSRVKINDRIYTVEDRMNARYNGKYIVDIWFPSRTEALQFGVRVMEMEVVLLPR